MSYLEGNIVKRYSKWCLGMSWFGLCKSHSEIVYSKHSTTIQSTTTSIDRQPTTDTDIPDGYSTLGTTVATTTITTTTWPTHYTEQEYTTIIDG